VVSLVLNRSWPRPSPSGRSLSHSDARRIDPAGTTPPSLLAPGPTSSAAQTRDTRALAYA